MHETPEIEELSSALAALDGSFQGRALPELYAVIGAARAVVNSSRAGAPAPDPATWLADASTTRAKAATDQTLATILLLAEAAREDYPQAKGIKLGDSDQGDYYIVAALLDADESEIDDGFTFDDNTGYVYALDDSVFENLEPFCVKGPDGQPRAYVSRRSGVMDAILDIDKILAEIKPA